MSIAPERLSPAAWAFRAAHGAITVAFLVAIVYVWWCALTRRRDRWLRLAVSALVTEGALVAANHGDCPLGPLQERHGDPVPLFELVLSPTAARRAVPTLGLITAAGLTLLARRPTLSRRTTARNRSRVKGGWSCGQNVQPKPECHQRRDERHEARGGGYWF